MRRVLCGAGVSTSLEATGKAGKAMKYFGKKAGMVANVAEVGSNGYELYQGEISTGRFVFRTVGTILSAGAGLAGPPGFVLGIGIDKSFQGVEQSYDIISPQIQSSFNHFINNINASVSNAAMLNNRR